MGGRMRSPCAFDRDVLLSGISVRRGEAQFCAQASGTEHLPFCQYSNSVNESVSLEGKPSPGSLVSDF
jgi:hypothetical protein